MIKVLLLAATLSGGLMAQSISLAHPPQIKSQKAKQLKKPKTVPFDKKVDFVEFREASLENVLRLLRYEGRLHTVGSYDPQSPINLRLVDTDWKNLQETVLKEALPLKEPLDN